MLKMNFHRKSAARKERQQRKINAGFLDAQFPEVAGIVISMIYKQRDIQESLPRIVNFYPGSYAVFRIPCLNKECVDGGFDLTQAITGMIRKRKKASKGELSCEGGLSSGHSYITYEIAIKYS